jgi:predicted secreted Zn-dependent protease
MRGMMWFGVTLLLCGCSARRPARLMADNPAIQISLRTTYYMVDLNDPRSLSRGMWDAGLTGRSGVVGSASPSYRWSFDAVSEGRVCVVRSLRVTGEMRITLPRWSAPTGTSQERRLWWQGYSSSIALHEQMHVRIFEDYVRDMLRAVEGMSAPDCGEARSRALSALRRGTEVMNQRQAEFDRSDGTIMLGLPPPS